MDEGGRHAERVGDVRAVEPRVGEKRSRSEDGTMDDRVAGSMPEYV
jgi:hypothetical protein